jgi:nicotinate-nucleotide--dimethylbenzimidazole phosphoribosyltransferase
MKEKDLELVLTSIKATNRAAYEKAMERLDMLAKPPGSLGGLEAIAAKLAAITGSIGSPLDERCVLVFSSDNGVVEEGVASAPQAITAIQTLNILNGITGVAVLAKQFNASLTVIDVGINADIKHPELVNKKIRRSTYNIAKQAAMSREEAIKAILIGIEAVKNASEKGYKVIGIGEMGIGNTTTSSAVLSAILGLSDDEIESVTGRGAGLTDEGFIKKTTGIKTALRVNKPDTNDPIDVISKVGGFDIAAMTGAFIGAAYYHVPVVIDGFISAVAALCATRMNSVVKEYLFASHHSYERGYRLAIEELGMKACLNLDMRLGEGSGCPLMFGIMDAACAIIKNMATFDEAAIDMEYLENINTPNAF